MRTHRSYQARIVLFFFLGSLLFPLITEGQKGFSALLEPLEKVRVKALAPDPDGGIAVFGNVKEEGGRRARGSQKLYFARVGVDGKFKESKVFDCECPTPVHASKSKDEGYRVIARRGYAYTCALRLSEKGELLEAERIGSQRPLNAQYIDEYKGKTYIFDTPSDEDIKENARIVVLGQDGDPEKDIPLSVLDQLKGGPGGGTTVSHFSVTDSGFALIAGRQEELLEIGWDGALDRRYAFRHPNPQKVSREHPPRSPLAQEAIDQRGVLHFRSTGSGRKEMGFPAAKKSAYLDSMRSVLRKRIRKKLEEQQSPIPRMDEEEMKQKLEERLKKRMEKLKGSLEKKVEIERYHLEASRRDHEGKLLWKRSYQVPARLPKGKVWKGDPEGFQDHDLGVRDPHFISDDNGGGFFLARHKEWDQDVNSVRERLFLLKVNDQGKPLWSRSYRVASPENDVDGFELSSGGSRKAFMSATPDTGLFLLGYRKISELRGNTNTRGLPNKKELYRKAKDHYMLRIGADKKMGCGSENIELESVELDTGLAKVKAFSPSPLVRDAASYTRTARVSSETKRLSAACDTLTLIPDVQHPFQSSSGQGKIEVKGAKGKAPYRFVWDNGEEGAKRKGLDPGSYAVKVQDDRGCSSRDTINVMSDLRYQMLVRAGSPVNGKEFSIEKHRPKDILSTEEGIYVTGMLKPDYVPGTLEPKKGGKKRIFFAEHDAEGNVERFRSFEASVLERSDHIELSRNQEAPELQLEAMKLYQVDDGFLLTGGVAVGTKESYDLSYPQPFVLKLSERGVPQWNNWLFQSRHASIPLERAKDRKKGANPYQVELQEAPGGGYLVSGTIENIDGKKEAMLSKIGPQGKLQWGRSLVLGKFTQPTDLAIGPEGKSYLLGTTVFVNKEKTPDNPYQTEKTEKERKSFLAKFDGSELLWTRFLENKEDPYKRPMSVLTPEEDRVLVTDLLHLERRRRGKKAISITRLDASGNVKARNAYRTEGWRIEQLTDQVEEKDGHYQLFGKAYPKKKAYKTKQERAFALELNPSGEAEGMRFFGPIAEEPEKSPDLELGAVDLNEEGALFMTGYEETSRDRPRRERKPDEPLKKGGYYLTRQAFGTETSSPSFFMKRFPVKDREVKGSGVSAEDSLHAKIGTDRFGILPRERSSYRRLIQHPTCKVERVHARRTSDGDAVNVEAKGPSNTYRYDWSHGPSGKRLKDPEPGVHTVEVEDRSGCSTRAAVWIPKDRKQENMALKSQAAFEKRGDERIFCEAEADQLTLNGLKKGSNSSWGKAFLFGEYREPPKILDLKGFEADEGSHTMLLRVETEGSGKGRYGRYHPYAWIRTDAKGNYEWGRILKGLKHRGNFRSMHSIEDGGYILSSKTRTAFSDSDKKKARPHPFLLKITEKGELAWAKLFKEVGPFEVSAGPGEQVLLSHVMERDGKGDLLGVHRLDPEEGAIQEKRFYEVMVDEEEAPEGNGGLLRGAINDAHYEKGEGGFFLIPLRGSKTSFLAKLDQDLGSSKKGRAFHTLKAGSEDAEFSKLENGRSLLLHEADRSELPNSSRYGGQIMKLDEKGKLLKSRDLRIPEGFDKDVVEYEELHGISDTSMGFFVHENTNNGERNWVRTEGDLYDRCALRGSSEIQDAPLRTRKVSLEKVFEEKPIEDLELTPFRPDSIEDRLRRFAETCEHPCPKLRLSVTSSKMTDAKDPNGALKLKISNGTPPYRIRWSTGDTTRNVEGLKAGSYRVTVTDAKGCRISTREKVKGTLPEQKWLEDIEVRKLHQNETGWTMTGRIGNVGYRDTNTRAALLRMNKKGELLWKRAYGVDSTREGAFDLAPLPNGGHMVAGIVDRPDASQRISLIKTGAQGELKWARSIGGAKKDAVRSIERTPEGAFAIAGYTESFGGEGKEAYVLKVNEQGKLLWTKTFGTGGHDMLEDLEVTDEGDILVVGSSKPQNEREKDARLLMGRIAQKGTLKWSRSFGKEGPSWGDRIEKGPDGTFLVAYRRFRKTEERDREKTAGILAIRASGKIEWNKSYDLRNRGSAHQSVSTLRYKDGNIYLMGTVGGYGLSSKPAYLIRTNEEGEPRMHRELIPPHDNYNDLGQDLLAWEPLSDGSTAILGSSMSKAWRLYYARTLPDMRLPLAAVRNRLGMGWSFELRTHEKSLADREIENSGTGGRIKKLSCPTSDFELRESWIEP